MTATSVSTRTASIPRHVPLRVGRFRLLEPIGHGGMGTVFRAELVGEGGFLKDVALKLPAAVEGPQRYAVEEALRHEARIGAMLRHPNIVDIYDYGVDDGRPWLSMEYVAGPTLDAVLKAGLRLPPTVVLDIARRLCDALAHVHQLHDGTAPLVHRDLKPSNILLSRHGRVKLTDFGIAKTDLISGCTTASGVMKGTPSFIAPEQILGERVDGRADLFAAGAILYEMATGTRLFRRHHSDAMIAAVLAVDEVLSGPGVLALVDERIPGLAAVIERCLQRNPARRYADAAGLDRALRELDRTLPPGPDLRDFPLPKSLGGSGSPPVSEDELGAVAESPADAILRLARSRRPLVSAPVVPGPATAARPGPSSLRPLTHIALGAVALMMAGPAGGEPPPTAAPALVIAPHGEPASIVLTPPPTKSATQEPRARMPAARGSREPGSPGPNESEDEPPFVATPTETQSPATRLLHPNPVTTVMVGERRSFIVRAASKTSAVSLVIETEHGTHTRALSPFRDGFWGLVVPFFAEMKGSRRYRFEGPGLETTEWFELRVRPASEG